MKLTYAVVIEQTSNNHAAYAPEVPGCISTAKTWDEMLAMIRVSQRSTRQGQRGGTGGIRGTPATLSTTFRMVEIEVSALQLAIT